MGFMEGSAPAGNRGGLAAFGLGSDSGWGLDWLAAGGTDKLGRGSSLGQRPGGGECVWEPVSCTVWLKQERLYTWAKLAFKVRGTERKCCVVPAASHSLPHLPPALLNGPGTVRSWPRKVTLGKQWPLTCDGLEEEEGAFLLLGREP